MMTKDEIEKVKLFETGRIIRQFLGMCANENALLFDTVMENTLNLEELEELVAKFLDSESNG